MIIRLISVFALALLLSSCGGNGEESGGYGSIAFSVDWMDAPTLDLSHGASRAAIDCTASGVATVTATVYDSGNNAIATGGPWACTAHSGAITNVPAGASRKLVIVGNDSEGKVKYRGELSGITVEDGKSIDAGSVATVNFVPALSTPANGVTVTNGAFSFTWAGIGSAASYRIQVSTNSGFSSTAIDTTVSTNSFTPSSQLSGTYYWRVRAIDAMAHDGAWSVAYSCTVSSAQGTAPTAPTGVTATAGEGQVAISWSTVSGATSYNLYWATTSGVTKTNGTKIAGVTSPYAHTGLTNGTKYYYVVTAVNGYGESAISSEVSGTPRVATIVPTSGLVAFYPFDGNANDASGNANNGVIWGATLANNTGNANSAYSFNGTNNYIEVSDNSSLDMTGSLTISFWMKPVTWKNAAGIVSKKANDYSNGYVVYDDNISDYNSARINLRMSGTAGSSPFLLSRSTVDIGSWQHWAFTYDSSAKTVKIYKNGVLDQIYISVDIGDMSNSTTMHIGHSQTWGGYFNGSIDQLRIFNTTLSDADVQTLYSGNL